MSYTKRLLAFLFGLRFCRSCGHRVDGLTAAQYAGACRDCVDATLRWIRDMKWHVTVER